MSSTGIVIVIALSAAQAAAAETQVESVRCGSYCLYVALRSLDVEITSYDELEGRLGPPTLEGYSLGKLDEVARSYGVQTLGVVTSFENLKRRTGRFACIAHLESPPHFVNFAEVDESGGVFVIDPPRTYSAPADTLSTRWKGKSLLLSKGTLVPEEALRPRFGWIIAAACAGIMLTAWAGRFALLRRREMR